jgi:hypothetical protein
LPFFAIEAAVIEQRRELHAGEFAAGEHPVRVLHRRHRDIAPLHAGVRAALDEVHARDSRQAHEVVHRVHLRFAHEAHHHEAMLRGVDVPPALVMAFEVQAVGRDDPEEALQRGERDRGSAHARESGAFATLQVLLVLRRQPVAAGRDRLAERSAVLREVQDRGIARLGCDCAAGTQRRGRDEGATQEVAPSRLHFGDLGGVQEIFRGALNAPRVTHDASLGRTVYISQV